jgi:hypothetical protein
VLTAGDYRWAVDISQAAQEIAPKSGSAFIQATAQEGRAWARLGAAPQTRAALGRVEALVSPLPPAATAVAGRRCRDDVISCSPSCAVKSSKYLTLKVARANWSGKVCVTSGVDVRDLDHA